MGEPIVVVPNTEGGLTVLGNLLRMVAAKFRLLATSAEAKQVCLRKDRVVLGVTNVFVFGFLSLMYFNVYVMCNRCPVVVAFLERPLPYIIIPIHVQTCISFYVLKHLCSARDSRMPVDLRIT